MLGCGGGLPSRKTSGVIAVAVVLGRGRRSCQVHSRAGAQHAAAAARIEIDRALAFTIHLSLLGERGLRDLAALNHAKARELRDALAGVPGVEVLTPRFFNEFAIRLKGDAAAAVDALLADGVVAGVPFSRLDPGAGMDDVLLVAATETTTTQDIQTFAQALAGRTA